MKFAVLFLSLFLLAGGAQAATIGVPVTATGSSTTTGTVLGAHPLGPGTIEYYIPLSGSGSCVYGTECGTAPDYGDGGQKLRMFLMFDPILTGTPLQLDLHFEDLDLRNVNDPWYFLERLRIFDEDNNPLTDWITNINDPLVVGNNDTQMLSLLLVAQASSPLWVELRFKARSKWNGYNTPEYLLAKVSAVPLPAAAWLFLSGLGGLAMLRRRRTA